MASCTEVSSFKHFGGYNKRYKHSSAVLGCDMFFTIFFPPGFDSTKSGGEKVKLRCWLPENTAKGATVPATADSPFIFLATPPALLVFRVLY